MARKMRSEGDSTEIYHAKQSLRRAAREVANCPHCAEGWREVEGGVVRCECWGQYANALRILVNLDGDVFIEDSMTNFKPDNHGPYVPIDQIRAWRNDLERQVGRSE